MYNRTEAELWLVLRKRPLSSLAEEGPVVRSVTVTADRALAGRIRQDRESRDGRFTHSVLPVYPTWLT